MKVIIHQALCGENENDRSSGFSLLKTTLEDKALSKKILPKTNLADLPSSGISWIPAVRGFLVDQHFLIIKTYPDNSPKVRTGRLFSHVLIINKDDIGGINDISTLFARFDEEINKDLVIHPIQYHSDNHSQSDYTSREKKVAQGIVSNKRNIIWIGQSGFEDIICKIWRGLDIAARCELNFGIQFNSNQAHTDKFNILAIPESIAVQWRNKSDFFLIELQEPDIPLSLATKSILGNDEAKAQFENFRNKIEVLFPSIGDLETWKWCVETTESIEKGQEIKFADVRQLLMLICVYSKDKNKGDTFKQRVLGVLTELLKRTSDTSEILSLRDVDFGAIKNADSILQQALKEWCDGHLFDEKFNKDNSCISIIGKLSDTRHTSAWWRKSIEENLVNKFKCWQKDYAKVCWLWLNENSQTFDFLFPFLPEQNKQIETVLIDTFPKPCLIAKDVLLDIASFAASKQWYKLHAAAVCELREELPATLKRQLQVDTDKNSLDGFEYIANTFRPLDFIGESAHLNDERLWAISGKLLPKTNFIERLDYSYIGWYNIICKAVEQGATMGNLFQYPLGFTHCALDFLLRGEDLPDELWTILITSKLTDIYDYKQREKAWGVLPQKVKKNFLQETASTYLESNDMNPEKELQDYLNGNSFLQEYFNQNKRNLSAILHLFSKVNVTNQSLLAKFIDEYNEQLPQLDAISLGKIVSRKDWGKCAENIYEKSKRNVSYRIALQECYSLLGLLSRFSVSLSGWLSNIAISEDEWWKSLNKTACILFPKGANEGNLWEKAGGKESELHHNTAGEDIWQKALTKLRRGGCKGITVPKLLEAMESEFPSNQKLNDLKKLYDRI